jgi:hypothetical protein
MVDAVLPVTTTLPVLASSFAVAFIAAAAFAKGEFKAITVIIGASASKPSRLLRRCGGMLLFFIKPQLLSIFFKVNFLKNHLQRVGG